MPGLYIYSLGKCLISLKKERKNSMVITYLDAYNPNTKTWTKYNVNTYDEKKQNGSRIVLIYADGENLYTIEERYDAGG